MLLVGVSKVPADASQMGALDSRRGLKGPPAAVVALKIRRTSFRGSRACEMINESNPCRQTFAATHIDRSKSSLLAPKIDLEIQAREKTNKSESIRRTTNSTLN